MAKKIKPSNHKKSVIKVAVLLAAVSGIIAGSLKGYDVGSDRLNTYLINKVSSAHNLNVATSYLALSAGHSVVINLNDDITDESIDSVIKTIKEVEELSKGSLFQARVLIDINSPGGSVLAFYRLQNFLSTTKVKITTMVRSGHMAASAGALILMLGDERLVDSNARVLFHGVHTGQGPEFMFIYNKLDVKILKTDLFKKIYTQLTKPESENELTVASMGSGLFSAREIYTKFINEKIKSMGLTSQIDSLDPIVRVHFFELMMNALLKGYGAVLNNAHIEATTNDAIVRSNESTFSKYLTENPGKTFSDIIRDLYLNFKLEGFVSGFDMITKGYVSEIPADMKKAGDAFDEANPSKIMIKVKKSR